MPDITMLDSHFTPYHSSSKNYATFNCSAHYSLAMVRSHCFGSIIAYFLILLSLRLNTSHTIISCCPIMQKVRHYSWGTLTAYMSINSSSISPVIYLLFIFSFTVLFTIAKHAILSLEDGSPFQTTYKPFYLFLGCITITTGLSPSMVYLFQGISYSFCIRLVLFRSPLL